MLVPPLREGGFRGLELGLRAFGGARAIRVVHPEQQEIRPHRHDWPFLSLPALGGYRDASSEGETLIAAPCALLHPPGFEHANRIGNAGLETITIEFDPAWLGPDGAQLTLDQMHLWRGRTAARAARMLAAAWADPALDEKTLAALTLRLIRTVRDAEDRQPIWLPEVTTALDGEDRPTTKALARSLGLHPAWLARAYRVAVGEGVLETLRRRRVERASVLLRRSTLPLAEIAIEAGFCDQSHMNRAFRALSGRTPLAVRRESHRLTPFDPA